MGHTRQTAHYVDVLRGPRLGAQGVVLPAVEFVDHALIALSACGNVMVIVHVVLMCVCVRAAVYKFCRQ